jgi:hypothetical protein
LIVLIFDFAIGQIITKQGENIEYTITSNLQIENKIEFNLSFDNPTLIYIDSIKINDAKLEIVRNNYILRCSSDKIPIGNLDLMLFGTTLYGTDTLTYIKFSDVKIDNKDIDIEPIKVIVELEYGHLYSRFARITKIYPNPTNRWNGFEIEYVIDSDCDVNIIIVNEVGKNLLELEYKSHPKGIHKIFIDNIQNYSIGVYYAYFKTKVGTNVYPFIIKN